MRFPNERYPLLTTSEIATEGNPIPIGGEISGADTNAKWKLVIKHKTFAENLKNNTKW